MRKEEIIARVRELNFPKNSYVVGWKERRKSQDDIPLVKDVFEAHDNWDFSPYSPTLGHLLETAEIIDGIPFASIKEVRKWKAAWGRPKDIADIRLIDKFLSL